MTFWEQRHGDALARLAEGKQFEEPPDPLLVSFAAPLKPGRALDLACGLGRNALWLAEHGWRVTAVDRSEAATTFLRSEADRRKLPLTVIANDLELGKFVIQPESWDLVLIANYLQRDLYEPAKGGVAPGGVLIAGALLVEPGHEGRFRAEPGELREYFNDWEILHYGEAAKSGAASHAIAEIVAQKPNF